MNKNEALCIISLRLAIFTPIFLASFLGCTSFPRSPFVPPTPSLQPRLTHPIELATMQDQASQLSLTSTIEPTNTVSTQLPKPATLTPSVASTKHMQTVTLSEELVQEMLGQVDIDRALRDLKRLTGEAPICIEDRCRTITDRETESEGLRWAKRYVYNELVNLGYSVELRDWSRDGWTDQNIIAIKLGNLQPEEVIYFVAHMDGVQSSPAADDNASGVVDLLEVAKVLSDYALSRTVVLLFTTGEEHGSLGSRTYVDQLSPEEIRKIKYVVNIDMIGYDANSDGVMQLWPGDHAPSLAFTQVISETIQTYQLDLAPRIITDCY